MDGKKARMPIKAKPYAHQEKAFEFALKTFGVITSEEDDKKSNSQSNERKAVQDDC